MAKTYKQISRKRKKKTGRAGRNQSNTFLYLFILQPAKNKRTSEPACRLDRTSVSDIEHSGRERGKK
jgi:hypothetical protein